MKRKTNSKNLVLKSMIAAFISGIVFLYLTRNDDNTTEPSEGDAETGLDKLQKKLAEAVDKEDYILAADLRDIINKRKKVI